MLEKTVREFIPVLLGAPEGLPDPDIEGQTRFALEYMSAGAKEFKSVYLVAAASFKVLAVLLKRKPWSAMTAEDSSQPRKTAAPNRWKYRPENPNPDPCPRPLRSATFFSSSAFSTASTNPAKSKIRRYCWLVSSWEVSGRNASASMRSHRP